MDINLRKSPPETQRGSVHYYSQQHLPRATNALQGQKSSNGGDLNKMEVPFSCEIPNISSAGLV